MAQLHTKEMVLPAHISEGLQSMLGAGSGGAGGDIHMHFHGPADGPSIQRWFKDNMMANSSAIKQMFRQGALTTRSI
jgi:hypothetical protein